MVGDGSEEEAQVKGQGASAGEGRWQTRIASGGRQCSLQEVGAKVGVVHCTSWRKDWGVSSAQVAAAVGHCPGLAPLTWGRGGK